MPRSQFLPRLALLLTATPLLIGSLGPRTNFNDRLLAAQNRERAVMDVPPLAWDEGLAKGAAVWAKHLSRTGRFEHSPDEPGATPEGENIWGGTPGYYLPENMVGLWTAEKREFRPGIFPYASRTRRVEDVSHYTQMIWRRTTHVGCASSAAGAEEILVCRYSTAGNVIGERIL
ncbi:MULTISPECIES: CAP domain-containing protein [Sphingomonas]|uniref:CAP domain-containing protein n=1 Tax=Sphingomonas TaxID=13687 RepID=UPI000DEEF79E|nr:MULTISPECIES: CAP domain-containing protein [Sphingomonas]